MEIKKTLTIEYFIKALYYYLKLAETFKSVLQTIKMEFFAYYSLTRKFKFH